MDYAITKQIAPLAAPGTRTSHINRAFNAALGTFLQEKKGEEYDRLYTNYVNIKPRFRPSAGDCDTWDQVDDHDPALRKMLDGGVIRFGYVRGELDLYVYSKGDHLAGFDYDLGNAVTALISQHYFNDSARLRTQWVEVKPEGGDQADSLKALYQGLLNGDFDIALSGQMMLPQAYMGDIDIEWTAPTALLFTAITYTGMDSSKLDCRKLGALESKDLPDFQEYAVAESKRLGLELRVFSVWNPGPSPTSATNLVYTIHDKGGKAVWDTGDVKDSGTVIVSDVDHFMVGDSLASGAQTKLKDFHGRYLNIPANSELWPIAGFTAGGGSATQGIEIAVFAEHSDTKKPMQIDETLPPRDQGWNTRVFNRTEVLKGKTISLQEGTGVVTLAPGFYHITAISIVTYDDLAAMGKVSTDPEPYAGYCRLRYADDVACDNEDAISIGTMSTANMLPSTIDTYLEVKKESRILLEHQVGNKVEHIYLQGIWENSSWHVFARITIRRLG